MIPSLFPIIATCCVPTDDLFFDDTGMKMTTIPLNLLEAPLLQAKENLGKLSLNSQDYDCPKVLKKR